MGTRGKQLKREGDDSPESSAKVSNASLWRSASLSTEKAFIFFFTSLKVILQRSTSKKRNAKSEESGE
jgi:hypothetical protein